jgi:hypothetical protein
VPVDPVLDESTERFQRLLERAVDHLGHLDRVAGPRSRSFSLPCPPAGAWNASACVTPRANGGPAVAAYLPDQNGTSVRYGLMALTITNGTVATITGFPDPALFPIFGLPS